MLAERTPPAHPPRLEVSKKSSELDAQVLPEYCSLINNGQGPRRRAGTRRANITLGAAHCVSAAAPLVEVMEVESTGEADAAEPDDISMSADSNATSTPDAPSRDLIADADAFVAPRAAAADNNNNEASMLVTELPEDPPARAPQWKAQQETTFNPVEAPAAAMNGEQHAAARPPPLPPLPLALAPASAAATGASVARKPVVVMAVEIVEDDEPWQDDEERDAGGEEDEEELNGLDEDDPIRIERIRTPMDVIEEEEEEEETEDGEPERNVQVDTAIEQQPLEVDTDHLPSDADLLVVEENVNSAPLDEETILKQAAAHDVIARRARRKSLGRKAEAEAEAAAQAHRLFEEKREKARRVIGEAAVAKALRIAQAKKEKEEREAAEEAARQEAKAKEEAAQAQESAARVAAAKRLKANSKLPAQYFLLPSSQREVLEAALFHAHAEQRCALRLVDIHTAALCLHALPTLVSAWGAQTATGDSRAQAIKRAIGELQMLDRAEIDSLLQRAKGADMPVIECTSTEPFEAVCSDSELMSFFAAEGIARGFLLPPEARMPWQWGSWWDSALKYGGAIGHDFERGLAQSSGVHDGEELTLRACIGGSRSTSMTAVGLLLRTLVSIDLRDNRVTDEEAKGIAAAFEHTASLTRLNLAGNRITVLGASALGEALVVGPGQRSLTELELSRNRLGDKSTGDTNSDGSGSGSRLAALARAASSHAVLGLLSLSAVGLSDATAANFLRKMTEPSSMETAQPRKTKSAGATAKAVATTPQRALLGIAPSVGASSTKSRLLTKLDLSCNSLNVGFATVLGEALKACPALTYLDLHANSLGAEGGRIVAEAVSGGGPLKVLDLSSNDLCNAGLHVSEGVASRGEWTGDAIFALCDLLLSGANVTELIIHKNSVCGLWSEMICGVPGTRGVYTPSAINAIIAVLEQEKLSLKPSADSLRIKALVEHDFLRVADEKRLLAAIKANGRKALRGVSTASDSASGTGSPPRRLSSPGIDRRNSATALIADHSVLTPVQPVQSPLAASPDEAKQRPKAAPLAMSATETQVASGGDGDAEGKDDGDGDAAEGATSVAAVAALVAPSPRAKSESEGKKTMRGVPKLRAKGGSAADGEATTERSSPFAKSGTVKASPRSNKGALSSARGSKGSATPRSSKSSSGSGLTPRGSRKSGGSGGSSEGAATHRTQASSSAKDDGTEKSGAAADRSAMARSVTGGLRGATAISGKKKKKDQEMVVEEAPNPFHNKPLMISLAPLAVRQGVAVDSPTVGSKIAQGSLMRVSETQTLEDGTRRDYVALDGDTEPLGWVTGFTKDEVENLKLAAAGFPLFRAAKTLVCREDKDNSSKKLEDVPKEALLRVMERTLVADGTEKALVAKDGPTAEPYGWVTVAKQGKEEQPNIEPARELKLSFDLKIHTAEAMTQVLKRKSDGSVVRRRKGQDDGLPFQLAGRRPPRDMDMPSRHRLVEQPADMVLMFNCNNAAFEVTKWSGDGAFDKLPGEQQFDLVSKRSRKRLGVVRLAKELGMPFLERVDFPDEWVIAGDHGLVHDGWQGAGELDLELNWGGQIATMRVYPWLAYGCSVGARFLIRKVSQSSGSTATVQRILADDRVVARVDGYSKAEGVKGEMMVDLMPSTVVRTTMPGYARDTRLLVLHNNKLTDAVVLQWLGSTNPEEGSRHMVNLKAPGAQTGAQAWPALNMFNHVQAVAGMSAVKFETTRLRYCLHLVAHEDKVEDAITGNSLEIKDQLIFMKGLSINDGCNPPEFMACSDVPQLVKLLTVESPKRSHGMHTAQPVLCRAGPGTGKTWMVKQCLFLVASVLSEQDETGDKSKSGEGIKLVPVIVFVQRIVRLLNELGEEPATLLADPEGVMRWYIGHEFAERKEECQMLLQAYDMRALVILVDGVDEAAGLREIVEAFVHYELVPSGNRLVVTSRPEGVDIEDYKTRFVVMNLLELSQEQQRNVIQMQLQGNLFFEHLVNIAECRKSLDARYIQVFRTEAMRNEIEGIGVAKEGEEVAEGGESGEGGESKGRTDASASKDTQDVAGGKKESTSPPKARRGSTIEDAGNVKARRSSIVEGVDGAKSRRSSLADVQAAGALDTPVVVNTHRMVLTRRRMSLDNHQDLIDYLAKIDMRATLRSKFLDPLHKQMMKANKVHGIALDHLETEIRALPSPCTRSLMEATVDRIEKARFAVGKPFDHAVRESLVQLGLQRKLPIAGGRRGAKAAPIPANGLWHQVIQQVDPVYARMEHLVPTLMRLLDKSIEGLGIDLYRAATGETDDGVEGDGNNADLELNAIAGAPAPAAAEMMAARRERLALERDPSPWMTFRDPVDMWLSSTYAGTTEPAGHHPEVWCATWVVTCNSADQCIKLLQRLQQGVELSLGGEPSASLTLQSLTNKFTPETLHPTHLRNALCDMLLTVGEASVAVIVRVEHNDLVRLFTEANFHLHYDFFWYRVLNMTQVAFDIKFETLLIFLVEAIGVPVLLSLLLLTYSSKSASDASGGGSNAAEINLDDLPQDRLQLYKLGIMSGIRKRLAHALANEASNSAEAAAEAQEQEQQAAEGRQRREKRKGALELTMGGGGGVSASTSTEQEQKAKKSKESNEPVLDLNSVLRGKKVRVVTGEDDVAEAYSLVVRVLDRIKGADLRTAITAVVPKSHSMHAPVQALVEYVIQPITQGETLLLETGTKMLRKVAVDNQEKGRREFTSKNVACTLGAFPEELGLWTRLEMDHDHGVALTATLAKQSEKAPAQYQFKHLSFQEGLYAEHLLILVTSMAPPDGPGWPGWKSDSSAADFLNNRYMNNTCRIAAGHLGGLLAVQRSHWDFREAPLSANGRSALWFITDENKHVETINVSNNDVGEDDVEGIAKMISTCTGLHALDLSDNDLQKLTVEAARWTMVGDALSGNKTLTNLNLNRNRLGSLGVRIVARSLQTCTGLRQLGLSYNEPGVEPALAELLRRHPSLTSVELVEALDRHLPSRAKDDIGRALTENKAKALGFLHCDMFVLSLETKSLVWPKEASTSDAVLLAGVLVTNTVLTSFNIAQGAQLANSARSALGEALLNNPGSRVAFCNDFGLAPSVDACEFDLSRTELKDVEPFRLLAGCLRGNRTLTHVTLKQLRSEQIPTLALALRGNSTLARLDIIHISRLGGQTIVRLPVPELNGSESVEGKDKKRVDMSATCLEGGLGRVACEMIGTLIAANTTLECLDLSNTGLGVAIGTEGEGGHILLKPLCDSKICPLNELNLSNIQLNDKAGAKLLSSLSSGLGKKMNGYDKITSLHLAQNDLGKQTGAMLKEVLWGDRAPCMLRYLDLSGNIGLDGYDTALAIKRNISLTSVDLRNIPSANTESIYQFLGTFLLGDDCQCRLGFLSCDAFQLAHEQVELDLSTMDRNVIANNEAGDEKEKAVGVQFEERRKGSRDVPASVLMLLAGVVKFNTSLRTLILKGTGFDDAAAGYLSTSLLENKVLEHLDISDNPVDAEGVAEIAAAVRMHPALETVKVDGHELPVVQLRGMNSAETSLDVADWGLGHLSGFMIGAITRRNGTLMEMNLRNNALRHGAAAVVEGLGEAPLRALDLTRNSIGDGDAEATHALSVAICQKLGTLQELKLDENELDCPPESLSPICKLRTLRTLSLEKNKLSVAPSLIGTMTSLRKISMHSNQLSELPASICLLAYLETLDLHKNLLKALPWGIGQLRSLMKFDLSENRLVELPVTVCELNDALQLAVGRNPLEKPSIEQARQGIGSIRRFFGWSKKREDEPGDREEHVATKEDDGSGAKLIIARPTRREEGAQSRHDWAQLAGTILLFNCHGASFKIVEGSADVTAIPSDGSVEITAAFNMQHIGHVRQARKVGEGFHERLQLDNEWLPWKTQDAVPSDQPALLANLKWTASGVGKQSASILITPWLAFGVSVGARIKVLSSGGFATVTHIRDDDLVDCIADNAASQSEDKTNPGRIRIDPRPDTVARTSSPSYKPGQKLLLLHDGVPVDASVEEWLGMRRGSRHRVRLGVRSDSKSGDEGVSVSTGASGGKAKEVIDVDLNETNHTKLLFPTVAKYDDARISYSDKLSVKHSALRDEATGKEMKVSEQRILLRTAPPLRAKEEKDIGAVGDGDKEMEEGASREGSPVGMRAAAPPQRAQRGGGRNTPSPTPMAPSSAQGSAAPSPTPEEAAQGEAAESSVHEMVESLLLPFVSKAPSAIVFSSCRAAHEMAVQQTLATLALMLRDGTAQLGPVRLVPLLLPMARIAEYFADETLSKQHPRALIIKAFEADYPAFSDVVKQAMEMRTLVIVADVREEADLAAFRESMLDELSINRLLVLSAVPVVAEQSMPRSLEERSARWEVSALGLYLNELKVSSRNSKDLFRRLRVEGGAGATTYYSLVTALHLGVSEIGRDAKEALQELLNSETCKIRSLDLSYTMSAERDFAYSLVQCLRTNRTLTSLDVRGVNGIQQLYTMIGETLLQVNQPCKLGYLRCDAFDVLEQQKRLSLRERPFEPGELSVIVGLLRNNRDLQEIDLTATDIEGGKEEISALVPILQANSTIATLKLAYNPALDEAAKELVKTLAAHRVPELNVEL